MTELIRFRKQAGEALPVQDEMHGASRPYLGLWEGEVGHISWLFTAEGRGRRLCLIHLEPDEVELDGAFTFRAFRGKGLLSEEDNIASIKGVIKTGFAPYGIVTFNRLVGLSWTHWRPATSAPFEIAYPVVSR